MEMDDLMLEVSMVRAAVQVDNISQVDPVCGVLLKARACGCVLNRI